MANFAACVQWEYMAYRYSISGIHKYGIIFVLTVVSSIANMDLGFVRQGTKVLALTIDYVSSLVHKDICFQSQRYSAEVKYEEWQKANTKNEGFACEYRPSTQHS